MARYIDADGLIEVLKEHRDYYAHNLSKITNEAMSCALSLAIREVKNTPTADVQEVKRGKWEMVKYPLTECSNCHICRNCEHEKGWNYCPNCGADMRGDAE